MKKTVFISALLLPLWAFSQCTNCGMGTNSPQSTFEIKGCGNTSATSSLGVKNTSTGSDSVMLFVRNDGNVGIGNFAPAYPLDIQKNGVGVISGMRLFNKATAANNTGSQLLFGSNRTTSGLTDIAGISGVITDVTQAAYKGALLFYTSNNAAPAERMRIDNAGNVGIAITSAARKLEVFDNTNPQLRLTYTGASVYTDLQTTSSGYLYVNPTGLRVGFGINAPAVGFHANLGITRFSDPGSSSRVLQINPNYAGSGEIPAGNNISTAINTTGEGFNILSSGAGTAGVKIGAYVYNGSTWRSVWETQNVASGNPNLIILKTGGNVGIGTTSPSANLAIVQTATATGVLKGINYTGAVNTNQTLSTEIPSVTITTTGRQWATGALTLQREVLITQPTYSFVGASTITDAANLAIAGAPIKSTNATITNTHGILVQAGAVSTATNSYGLTVNAQTGATNNYAAAFLGGSVGIGCATPQYALHVIGDIASSATVRTTNALVTGAITACSDIRYKNDITPLEGSLKNVMQLQGVSYHWKSKEFPEKKFNNKNQIGVIAQDIEKVYPEVVFTDADGYKSVDYSKLTPILIEAIKEQQHLIDEQRKFMESTQLSIIQLQKEFAEMKSEKHASVK